MVSAILFLAILALALQEYRVMSVITDLQAAVDRNTASVAALIAAITALPNQDAAIQAATTQINANSDSLDAETALITPPPTP
jgi:hypothetical protein